jgi:RNA polymerase sigma-70 factor, ECF subfamily
MRPLRRTLRDRQLQVAPGGVPEKDAIRRAQNGDPAAFEHLYRLHGRRVHNLCLRMVGDTGVAEDLTQEAFLQMYRKIGAFRGDSALSTWLHRIAVNIVLMHLRKKGLPSVSLDGLDHGGEDGSYTAEIGSPDTSWRSTVDRLNLSRAIHELSAGYKRIFVLHDVMGYAHNEIAGLLRCSVGNSKSQLRKARLRLRSSLHGNRQRRARGTRLSTASA